MSGETGSGPEEPGPEQRSEAEPNRRQAPRWGEYATPEELAELRGPDAAPPAPTPLAPPNGRPIPGPPPAGRTRAAGWDLVFTIALLAFGAFTVAQNIVGYLDLPATVAQELKSVGYGDVTVPASIRSWGYLLIAVDVLLLVGAAWLSLRRIRRGRMAFWVPIAAGAASGVIGAIVIVAVLASSGALANLPTQG